MKRLAAIQNGFYQGIVNEPAIAVELVENQNNLSADMRIGIYADAYRIRLLDVLADNYPAVHTLMGDAEFERLGRAYIDKWPSQTFTVSYFGHKLNDFIKTWIKTDTAELLAEMAAFEWALRRIFDSEDEPGVLLDELIQIDPVNWAGLQLEFVRHLVLLSFNWNVPELWKAIQQNEPSTKPRRLLAPQSWLVWRHGLNTRFRSLAGEESGLLDGMREQHSFAWMCEKLVSSGHNNAAEQSAGLLQQWILDGMVRSVRVVK